MDCDHIGKRRYVRRTFANGSIHFCVQCTACRETVKMPEHGNRPFIRLEEVPPGRLIGDYMPKWQGLDDSEDLL